jgi:D-alanyl-D-alanine carboxypeptidase
MKRLVLYCFVVLLILLVTACSSNNYGNSFNIDTQHRIETAVNGKLASYGGKDPIPGAVVGIWAPGKGTFVKGFGYANLSKREKMNVKDKFRVGSNTKTFVVSVLLQLVDEGKISLDDKLSKFHLGINVPNAQNITVRELCNMTTGLFEAYHSPQLDNVDIIQAKKFTPQQLIAIAIKNPPDFAPGKKWGYSNTNYLLLGLIIEAVTGNKVQNEIRNRLIIPYALNNTSFPTDDPGMPEPFSHGYTLVNDKWEDQTFLLPPSLSWAAGAMISDMEDMKRWVKAYVTGSTNSASTQAQRLNCVDTGKPNMKFGLGIGCTGGWYGYTGGIPGYNTAAYYLPSADATIIIFVNSQVEQPAPGIANSIVHDITRILFPQNIAFY